jgi:ketosteroid isomerase-like protein
MNDAAPETDFERALHEHLDAIVARDVARFEATLGEDVVTVDGSGAVTRGTGAVLASHASWFSTPEPWTFRYEIVLVRETASSGFALLRVTYEQGSALSRFLLSLVFARDAHGAHKFVYDQNTPLVR